MTMQILRAMLYRRSASELWKGEGSWVEGSQKACAAGHDHGDPEIQRYIGDQVNGLLIAILQRLWKQGA